MKINKLSIGVLFLFGATTTILAQQNNDTIKSTKAIEGVIIQGSNKKGKESNLINLQRKSAEVIENVGSEQLKKQGVGDVATAVTKATSTVKQEGSNTIAVRGLIDRYNTTTLNNLPIPSDDPENKNIDLGLLKTDIIDLIALEKVYNPRIIGDFGGANINIVSKEHTGKAYVGFNLGSGYNAQNAKADNFYTQEGLNYFGTKLPKIPANALTAYNFKSSWNFKDAFGPSILMPLNTNMSLDGGKSFKIGSGRLNLYAYAGFDNDFSYLTGKQGSYASEIFYQDYNKVQKFNYGTNTTGLLNLYYRINANHQLKWITYYTHSTLQEAKIYEGFSRDIAENGGAYVRRGENKITNVLVNQLGGDHKLTDKWSLNWIAGYNYLNSQRPDRITNTLVQNPETGMYSVTRESGLNNRYFDDLDDKEISGNLTLSYKLNDDFKISAGYQGRYKKRTFFSKQVDFKWNNEVAGFTAEVEDPNNLDQIFNAYNYSKNYFRITSNFGDAGVLKPVLYNGKQNITSGFANLDYKLSDKLMMQFGLRLDNIYQYIEWQVQYATPTNNGEYTYNKILPALNLKYSLTDRQNLRLAVSRTYTLPQLKEMAPYMYNDITETSIGNPYLKASDNNNIDLKWEYFPKSGEVLSITGFGKYIQNPISKTYINSSDPFFSYLNAGDWAYVFGVEAEIRKDIVNFGKSKLYTFLNASYMSSKAELNNDKVLKETKGLYSVNFDVKEDKLQGAADFVANANLGYNHKFYTGSDMDLTLAYSYVGNYVYSISTQTIGNIIQKPIHSLDFIAKLNFKNNVTVGLAAKNLINPEIRRVQENKINSETYNFQKGRIFSLSLGYKF
ncbi:TonB-dependent receptor [Chryseobacterium sp. POL2]|uniref:TonB-dependent receptor domain-containing protein n=1 Tax=Chryseobacterium sp. POL2 TaxID=2713414 RepID=UPI0013E12DC5|nr:TonB-dependent receptor [Chryseobacterium sp. POL2]QIG90861.1 TonB-dependent receptor [Chryseobacterium sp. POL2]